tara:strand:- start:49 stop:291 length:243 start_codon:yes stop_codon:yes gene_type:complete
MVFDLVNEDRLMIKECVGKQYLALLASYTTRIELGKAEHYFFNAANKYLEEYKSSDCKINHLFAMDDVTAGSYEAIYTCS